MSLAWGRLSDATIAMIGKSSLYSAKSPINMTGLTFWSITHGAVTRIWYRTVSSPGPVRFWQQPLWRWDAMFNAGVRAAYAASQLAAQMMGKQSSGLIVNISFWAAQKYLSPRLWRKFLRPLVGASPPK